MKRFKIKNNANGLSFQVEREELGEMQPEWGLPEREERNEMGEPTGVMLPAEYTIEVEDLAAEIAEREMKKREADLNEVVRKVARDKAVATKLESTKVDKTKLTQKELIDLVIKQGQVIEDILLWMSKVK